MQTDREVYGKLYDIVSANMEASGKHFTPARNVFLLAAQLEPQRTDMALLKDIGKEEIVQAAYAAVFRRLPGEEELRYWEQPAFYEKNDYKEFILKAVTYSVERDIKAIEVYHTEEVGLKLRFMKMKRLLSRVLGGVYKIYRKLPLTLRLRIRKVLRKGIAYE